MKHRARRVRGIGTTIFAEMSALAARTGAVNLGQGFPDSDGPGEVIEAAVAALRSGRNQYAPGTGVPLRMWASWRDRARSLDSSTRTKNSSFLVSFSS